jgi:hypothetical protein
LPHVRWPFLEGVSPAKVTWFVRVWAIAGLALIAGTWRLWTPQSVYPQVPLVPAGRLAPLWFDWIGVAGMMIALATALVANHRSSIGRAGLWVFASSATGMILLDQHRLQPWAYQFVLIALVLATRSDTRSFGLLRWLTVGIYFWSSLGKFDHVFLHGLGQQFAATALGWAGVVIDDWPPWLRLAAAGVFPAWELLVALGLLFGRSRTIALAGAVVMHLGLLAVLGPWGLDHQPGVLIWNLFFLAQAIFLFSPARRPEENVAAPEGDDDLTNARPQFGLAELIIALAITLPVLEPLRLWDHWPSWGLYSTRAERVTVLVHRLAAFRLPDELTPYLQRAPAGDDWRELEIDRWSLETLGAPVYPQARFQLGVAEAVGRRFELGGFIQAVHFYPSDRRTGERRQEAWVGVDAISEAASGSWLNGRPRPTGQALLRNGTK